MHYSLDDYLPERLRSWLEQRYYARVNQQARFEALIGDPDFWAEPSKHVGLFSDHGVVHVRDVARQLLQVLDAIHGLLIPARADERFAGFMRSYGVALAYLHDIGMADFSAFGRAMHPEFAAQEVFSPELEELIAELWAIGGPVPERIRQLAGRGGLRQPPEQVFRELLALSMAHSKSKVPVATLNDRERLRAVAQRSVGTSLRAQYLLQRGVGWQAPDPPGAGPTADAMPPWLAGRYADFERDSFRWLVDPAAGARALAADAIDTLRALRAADALRQRGTVMKTSGGYEVFISQQTAGAVFALRLGGDQLYLLETDDRKSAGEANIASTELDRAGNLRVAFHRGAFAAEEALAQAVACATIIVEDIRADVIESFERPDVAGLKPAAAIETWLESSDDNPGFAHMVCAALRRAGPAASAPIAVVPSLQQVPELERARYLAAAEVGWDDATRGAFLERMARSGYKAAPIDRREAFRHVRLARLQAGEVLIRADDPASMVYVPLGDGLRVLPLGGYGSFSVQAWMPLGNTGVIRGAARNGTVIAEHEVEALIIPKDVYLRHWHHTHSAEELRARLYTAGEPA